MIYFNNTACTIYFYGNVIKFYSIFNYQFINIDKLNISNDIRGILSNVFIPAKNDNDLYYDTVRQFHEVKFTNLSGVGDIVINDDVISVEEFNLRHLNRIFNKLDLIIINNTIESYEIIS
jgi:hypothetical protein